MKEANPPQEKKSAAEQPFGRWIALYRWMRSARDLDEKELELVARGEAFFQVSGTGHEASAGLAPALTASDYLHVHYRDKALLLARGIPPEEFFNGLLANASGNSQGRQMSAHLSAPNLNVLSLVGPVGNQALQAVGVAQQVRERPGRPIVLCSMGDGSSQQGEVLEAIAEAVRSSLPVFFLVHDNGYSISTQTEGKTFFSLPSGRSDVFYGLPVHHIDGRDPIACQVRFLSLIEEMRHTRRPVICVMKVARLCSHTNADDDSAYRPTGELAELRRHADPVERLRRQLLAFGVCERELTYLESDVKQQVLLASERSLERIELRPNLVPELRIRMDEMPEYLGTQHDRSLPLGTAIRETLRARLSLDPRVTLYGQDIEDPKGDVFGLTRGLSAQFPGRVVNAPLSESTIVGTSIGRALAGGRPVAFLQFADFLPLAFNQLACELSSIQWRSAGGWHAPVVILAACGAYRPGLGPFHSHTFESVAAHLPGLDVAMPSTGAAGAGALNAAFRSERPTLILLPKALLNDRTLGTSPDVARQFVPVGCARKLLSGSDLTLVAWGNTVRICERVAKTLATAGVHAELIDLRWISPWDRDLVVASAKKTRRLIVAHEDNAQTGFGAEVLAVVAEALPRHVICSRVARSETLVPCNYESQLDVLPSYSRILQSACGLLDISLEWEYPVEMEAGRVSVPMLGSSPADERVELVELAVRVGAAVKSGQLIASVEADKAIFDLAAPADGIVSAVHLKVGDQVSVGTPLLTLATSDRSLKRRVISGDPIARLTPRTSTCADFTVDARQVNIVGLGSELGRDRLENHELFARLPSLCRGADEGDGIFLRTGVSSRSVATPKQDVVSMAVDAGRLALQEAQIEAHQLALVICSTSTPRQVAPSTACEVLRILAPEAVVPAYDISAACSGYLYALAAAWDFLQVQNRPAHVLVLTSEIMRRIVDIDDPICSPIFGDAATATVLSNAASGRPSLAAVDRPVLGAVGDTAAMLQVPAAGSGSVRMDGRKVFAEAVRRMGGMLTQACDIARVNVSDLSLVVPHQANSRIIQALGSRLRLRPDQVCDEIRWHGNTSSSSIPLVLDSVLRNKVGISTIGVCSFGAGLTFGAAVLRKLSA